MKSTRSALDVAEYILGRLGELDGLKLQKLVYYCQAWSLVWRSEPIFDEQVEAWVHGPVVSELYQMHSGQRQILAVGGHAHRLSDGDRRVIDEVLLYYGDFDGLTLRKQTHREEPWKAARGNLAENQPSTTPIPADSMKNYYATRPCGADVQRPDFTCFDRKRIDCARSELSEGKWIGIEELGVANAARN